METSKYFLTIDVGTKNLAVCVCEHLEISNSSNLHNLPNLPNSPNSPNLPNSPDLKSNCLKKINIIDWKILDVSFKYLYCKQIKGKRAICNCKSKFYTLNTDIPNPSHDNPEHLIGYCKNHIKNIRIHNKNKINKNNQIKVFTINSNPIYKNSFSNQMEKLLNELENYFTTVITKPYHYISNKLLNISNLSVHIENQPVLKNPIMKSISMGIYVFFCMKKTLNQKIISSVNFINATVKTNNNFVLKLGDLTGIKSSIKNFTEYAKRKDFSEDIVKQIIAQLEYNQRFLNNSQSISNYFISKKKDDLADTLLYQIYIIVNN